MSNDEHEGHEDHAHFVPVNFSEFQRARDGARMANQVAIHGVNTMFSELNEEQLTNMSVLLRSLADPEQGPALASHMDGMVKMILHFKFGWCMCGEKHMEAEDMLMQDILNAPDEKVNTADHWSDDPGETYSDPGVMDKDIEALVELDAAHAAAAVLKGQLSRRETLMAQYNLIPFDGSMIEVQCKLCGTRYPNLRDRMLREPDDCSGCHQKARHG